MKGSALNFIYLHQLTTKSTLGVGKSQRYLGKHEDWRTRSRSQRWHAWVGRIALRQIPLLGMPVPKMNRMPSSISRPRHGLITREHLQSVAASYWAEWMSAGRRLLLGYAIPQKDRISLPTACCRLCRLRPGCH